MPDGDITTVKIVDDISEIKPKVWNSCAGPDNPFVSHEFLEVLEKSEAACENSGWLPQHLLVEDPNGLLLGCVPCYLKNTTPHTFTNQRVSRLEALATTNKRTIEL